MREDRHQVERARSDRWVRERLEEMALLPLADEPLAGRCHAFRLLCAPAFHAWCCVTVYDLDGLGEIRCVYGNAGHFIEVRVEVQADRIAVLRDRLLELEPAALEDAIDGGGRDGMVIYGEVRYDAVVHSWHIWTASVDGPMPRHHSYCVHLLDSTVQWTPDAALHRLVAATRSYLEPLEPPLERRGSGA